MPSVAEFAAWRGVSPQRVRDLLRAGELPGRRVGARQWEVDEAAYGARRRLGRPMSPRVAWALIALMSGQDPYPPLSSPELTRAREHLRVLHQLPDPAPLLSSWLRRRGDRLRFHIQPADLDHLLADERVTRSGISDPRAKLAAGDAGEAWLYNGDLLDDLTADYLLLPDPAGSLVLHRGAHHLEPDVPLGLVIADLADWNAPREDAQARQLLQGQP